MVDVPPNVSPWHVSDPHQPRTEHRITARFEASSAARASMSVFRRFPDYDSAGWERVQVTRTGQSMEALRDTQCGPFNAEFVRMVPSFGQSGLAHSLDEAFGLLRVPEKLRLGKLSHRIAWAVL